MLRLLLAAARLRCSRCPWASGIRSSRSSPRRSTATSITLVGADGKRVRVLQPNMYRIVVHDRTVKQNFHLLGRG